MEELKTRYITVDDFKIYTGIDLESELNDNNPSNAAIAFLKRIEIRVESYINKNYFYSVNVVHAKLTNYQKEQFKLALLEQALYVFKNHDIGVDSGYDGEKIQASRHYLNEIKIGSNALEHLENAGLLNAKFNAPRNGGWFY